MGDAATWGAIGTWVTLLVYIAILTYAVKQVGEAKKLRKAQVRPFVIIDIEPGYLIYIRVENLGHTVARNVRFEFPVALESSLEVPREIDDLPLFKRGLSTLPPGKSYRVLLDSFTSRGNLPMTYDAIVTYEDDSGDRYRDSYVLDMESFLNTSPDPDHLEKIARSLEQISKVHKAWTDGTRGLKVGVSDNDARASQSRRRLKRHDRNRRLKERAQVLPPVVQKLIEWVAPDPMRRERLGG